MKKKITRFLLLSLFFLANPILAGEAEDELAESVARMARIGSCWSPSFSPDGETLALISDLSGVPQVWTVPPRGGWPRRVTDQEDQVTMVRWSPKGDRLAFAMAPGGGMNRQVYLVQPDGSGVTRITDGGQDNNWLGKWSHDGRHLTLGSNRENPASVDAYVYDTATAHLAKIADNPGIGFVTDLGRDGSRAVVWRMRSRSDANLYLVDLKSGEEVLITAHEGPGTFGGGLFSRDGKTIYFTSNKDRDLVALARVSLDEHGGPGPAEFVAAREDAELGGIELSPDGRALLLIWNAGGRSEITFFDTENGKTTRGPDLPGDIVAGATFSPDGQHLALVLTGADAPRDIWILENKTGRLRQITHSPHPGVDLSAMVRPELVRFPAHDGLELSGWLYRPREQAAGAPGPLVLSFHGGPEGQERPWFRSDYQALLARGIAVFAPNVRGSSGFGKKFVNLDNGALRFNGVKDIESCVKYVVENEIADPERIGIMGGSYGGYMTMAGLTEYPGLFAAGANLFGVVNFETFFAHTEPWMAAISTVEYGNPVTEKELLRQLSPIHKIDRVTAPTIVLHGANDTNVPVVEAEQVVESLKKRGVPVEYVLFPDEGHGFSKEANRIRSTTAIVRWFDRYLNVGAQ